MSFTSQLPKQNHKGQAHNYIGEIMLKKRNTEIYLDTLFKCWYYEKDAWCTKISNLLPILIHQKTLND